MLLWFFSNNTAQSFTGKGIWLIHPRPPLEPVAPLSETQLQLECVRVDSVLTNHSQSLQLAYS